MENAKERLTGRGRSPRLTGRTSTLTALLVALASEPVPARAQEGVPIALSVTPSFAVDEWLDADAELELLVSPPLVPQAARLAVFLGETDLTPLFTVTPERLTYRAQTLRLPAGESELVVHLVTPDDRWTEVARIPIRVLTRAGFEKASCRPPRDTFQDLTAFTGFTTVHARSGWTVQTQLNVVGVSHREEALRFGEKGDATAGTCGTAGADYVAATGTVQFTGQLSQTANLQVCSDDLSEGNEQFGLRLTATENHANFFISVEPSRVPQLITITDDEPLPSLSITPTVQVAEPTSGQTNAVFTVSLSGPISQRDVTVDFATAPGTALAGSGCPLRTEPIDYVTKTGTLTFSPPGNLLLSAQFARTRQISVAVCSDSRRNEPDETFFVNLSRPINATLPMTSIRNPTVTRGTATIVD